MYGSTAWFLSKKKNNIRRDFSDGVLMVEILEKTFSKLVDINNYTETYSIQKKIYNWTTLNDKVLKKLNIQLSNAEIVSVANAEKFAIENILTKESLQYYSS